MDFFPFLIQIDRPYTDPMALNLVLKIKILNHRWVNQHSFIKVRCFMARRILDVGKELLQMIGSHHLRAVMAHQCLSVEFGVDDDFFIAIL